MGIITTALTLQIKSSMPEAELVSPAAAGGGGGASVVDVQSTAFMPAPIRDKPDGFGSAAADDDGIAESEQERKQKEEKKEEKEELNHIQFNVTLSLVIESFLQIFVRMTLLPKIR